VSAFARPWLLPLAAALPALAALALWLFARRRMRASRALGDAALVRRLAGQDLSRFPWVRALAMVLATALLGVAAAGPRWGVQASEARGAADAVLVLDASNSMLVPDVAPNRLEVERAFARHLIDAMPDRRVGLVVFAGKGYVLAPLTSDRGVLDLYLDNLSTAIVTQSGTSLSSAIRYAAGLLARAGDKQNGGSVVVISDGDALEEQADVLAAADDAARFGVSVTTVGVGTAAGGPVPDLDPVTGKANGFKHDLDGSVARSVMRADLLGSVSRRSGGAFVDASSPNATARVAAAASRGPASSGSTSGGPGSSAADRAWWFVAAALVLLAMDAILGARGNPRLVEGRVP
jgi:Ca-activated chloride channel family protein